MKTRLHSSRQSHVSLYNEWVQYTAIHMAFNVWQMIRTKAAISNLLSARCVLRVRFSWEDRQSKIMSVAWFLLALLVYNNPSERQRRSDERGARSPAKCAVRQATSHARMVPFSFIQPVHCCPLGSIKDVRATGHARMVTFSHVHRAHPPVIFNLLRMRGSDNVRQLLALVCCG